MSASHPQLTRVNRIGNESSTCALHANMFFFFFWSPFVQAAFVAFPLKYTVTHLRGIIKVLLGVIPCLAYVTMDLKD